MSGFDRIIGYTEIKAELKRFADVLKNPEKYWRFGASLPSGLLIYGEPGLGKTLMAKCFIEESGSKVFTLRKEKPNGDFINQIKETFEIAKKEKAAIVFLDDLDKFANEDEEHRDAEEYVAVQSCIDDCKDHNVFVLATVNDKYCLPDSLLRAGRFDKTIEVDVPRGKDAKEIIEHFISKKKYMGDIDIEEICRLLEGRSCAELETVINEAVYYAAYDNKDCVDQSDIVKASMRMMFDSPECVNPRDDIETRNIAVHEAGHAVVAEILDPGSVTLVSVCRHTGSIQGMTNIHKPVGYKVSKEIQEHDVMGGLGGKAAVEIVYGLQDMGCDIDLNKIYCMVECFVSDNCTLGFNSHVGHDSSQYAREMRDRLIASEVDRYYQQTKKILIENREFLDLVSQELMEKKTLTYRDIANIRKSLKIKAD